MLTFVACFACPFASRCCVAVAALTLRFDFAMRTTLNGALLAQLTLPWCGTLAFACLFMVELPVIEALFNLAFITEDSFEPFIAFACTRLFIKRPVATANYARVIIHVSAIHTGTGFFVHSFAIGAVQFALVALIPRPVLV